MEAYPEKEKILEWLFENFFEGVVVVNAQYIIADANPAAQKMLMSNGDKLPGKHICKLIPELKEVLKPHTEPFKKVMPMGGRIVELSFSGFEDAQLQGEYFIFVLRDITERLEHESIVKSALERVELAILAAGFDVWENDFLLNTRISENRVFRALGYSASESPTNMDDYIDFVHPDDSLKRLQSIQDHIDGVKEIYSCDFRLRSKKGTYEWVSSYGRVIERDENGNPIKLIGITLNVNQSKQAEAHLLKENEELAHANSEKDKFFSIIAHDLKGPFQGFIGLTELMSEGDMSQQETKEITEALKTTAKNIYELLDNLLNWAMIKRGHKKFNPQKVYLNALINSIVDLFASQLKAKNISILNKVSTDLVVLADQESLKTVLRNLISNAVKFTPKEGTVTVLADSFDKSFLKISIIDTGIGMPLEILNNLFAIDTKVSRQGTENEPSTGLGLILCKELVEKHGGRIWAETVEGKGSTFSFTIPSAF